MQCRICDSALGEPVYAAGAPSITSVATTLDVGASVYVCETCGHAQSPDLTDLATYYDTDYKINLASEDCDHLYDTVDGVPVFRADHQARLVRETCAPRPGARILDYGAAKAATLRLLLAEVPGAEGHVFDVSRDYQDSWRDWIPSERQAVYQLPAQWAGSFDLVTSHFVLEHVAEPLRMLRDLARMLKPDGKIFLLVPDAIANPGDLVVVDHVNHFTESSLTAALARAGLKLDRLERGAYRGAYVVVASLATGEVTATDRTLLARELAELAGIAALWRDVRKIVDAEAATLASRKLAIYGAGFYGTFIAAALENRIRPTCFLDRNPHAQKAPHLGLAVLDPAALPADVDAVFAGLNPRIARDVLERWKRDIGRPDLQMIYLDTPRSKAA
jgi:SAM-dependent methyltransferase